MRGGTPSRGPNVNESMDGQLDGYSTEEDNKRFDNDRKFSNVVLFLSSFLMVFIFMTSKVIHLKKEREVAERKLEPQKSSTKYTGKANIGGPWLLYNTKGEPVTHEDFQGKYYLIYFGFTFCPDVCPVSLMKMARSVEIVKSQKEYQYFDLASIFVSVDPDRDSNERIEEYCKIFDKEMVGLTHKSNDNPELKQILKNFKIHVSKILLSEEMEKEDMKTLEEHAPEVVHKLADLKKKKDEKYTLDHSIIVYLMGPDNKFLTYLGSNLDDKDMANLIVDEIQADLKRRVTSD